MTHSRRDVLLGLTGLPLSAWLTHADAAVTPDVARLRLEIEPLVALIERTPREKCAEMLASQLRRNVPYRQLLAALFLAGVRNINPRPPGFALHCVFVIHSAHLMSLEAPPDGRILPLFYALDQFKASQARDAAAAGGDFVLRAFTGLMPPPDRARGEFVAALDAWEPERAERAAVSLVRHHGPAEVFEILWRYGARDYRNIGHKAIFVANAHRTLNAIGWQHAEPVVRSLVLGLLDFARDQKVNGYAFDDQTYLPNVKRLPETFARLKAGWSEERADPAATRALLGVLREARPDEACQDAAGRLVKGQIQAGSVWDAVHLAAAELRMRARSSGLVAIHAVTSANALHYAYMASQDPQTRLLVLLQAAGWLGQFRAWAADREPGLRPVNITELEPAAPAASTEEALAEAFAEIPAQAERAAGRAFALARDPASRTAFLAAAKRSILLKADEVHYYKYTAALLEDIPLVSPEWQPHLTAALPYYLKGVKDAEAAVIQQARKLLT